MAKRSEACAGVDVGGTFTDVVVHAGGHSPRAVKVPTTPGDQAEGVAHGVHEGWPGGPPRLLPHGTTTTTNAVLERKIARTVLVTTEGFADVLQIARTGRRCTTCPWPARSRWCRTTRSLRLPSEPALTGARWSSSPTRRSGAWSARSSDPESIAISLLFSYAGTEHERRLTAALERLGVPISRSSALLPRFREFERASTCVLKRRDGAGDAPLPVQPLVPPARTEDHRDDLQRWHRRCRWGVPE